MIDVMQWIAAGANSIKIGEYAAKLFKSDLKGKEQLGAAKIAPVICCGKEGTPDDYRASDDPNAPSSHIVPVEIPAGARIINAWYSPLHNIRGMLAFALIDVEPYDDTHICLKVAAFPNANSVLRIAINVLYARK